MKVVILAGGFGTRISEESDLKPKPMIEIGNMPILWHVMKGYSYYGFNEFVICCGYKGNIIKDFFANYYIRNSDITFDFSSKNAVQVHNGFSEPWKVTLVDTKLDTMTGGRIKRIKDYITEDEFLLTYGDGVADVDIHELLECHRKSGRLGTLTAIQPESRFGILDIEDDGSVSAFREKQAIDVGWINGGFMVMNRKVFDYIEGDSTVFEKEPLERLAREGELQCYKHHGFWQCMDTLRDKRKLESLWETGKAPWKVWD